MYVCIWLLNRRFKPGSESWKRIFVVAALFEVPFQIGNILGITVFNLWLNNATSPITLLGSPIETIPFAFGAAVIALLFFREYTEWKPTLLLWLILTISCVSLAYVSTLYNFMTWVNWNIGFSFLYWLCLIGILKGMQLLIDYLFPIRGRVGPITQQEAIPEDD